MLFEKEIKEEIVKGFTDLFGIPLDPDKLVFQPTRKEFEGDITLVTFGLTKITGINPDELGQKLGDYLMKEGLYIASYNKIKGFLNLTLHNSLWLSNLNSSIKDLDFGFSTNRTKQPVLVEYSSPNTNKPLHLGHMRNILLGYSLSEILKRNGYTVFKVNIVNDRGIHICKSMLAWQKFGNGETPRSSGIKGDHLVGKYYVEFDKRYREQVIELTDKGYIKEEAEKKAPLLIEAQEMLRRWEQNDPETIELWKKMNGWVYTGFDVTYKNLGVDFDKIYYESETYLLGKSIVEKGLRDGLLNQKPDGSVWADLSSEGLDEKLLLRSDGTAVYMTQDLGTAVLRYDEFNFDKLIHVVGNEQDYHFRVLFSILKKLGYSWADKLYHLSYNMVDLPSGKMKSREGTVVDADELIDEMTEEARKITTELGKLTDFSSAEAFELFKQLGLGALKYYILKVDPEKRMLFNPEDSIDFNGNTGPFIQYTHARIQSVLRKASQEPSLSNYNSFDPMSVENLHPRERELILQLSRYPGTVQEAGERYSPALVANYAFELARHFNQFYHDCTIADSTQIEISKFRLQLSHKTGEVIKSALALLGITAPERM
jgi:arginyl-tRNA synthetase